jgi:hypothetical protein
VPGTDLDRTFYEQFLTLRRERLPIESDLYENLSELHRRQREAFDTRWALWNPRALPEASRDFVNRCFARAQAAAGPALAAAWIPAAHRQRAEQIYAFRLPFGATLLDLRNCDVFEGVLRPQDTNVPQLFAEGGPDAAIAPGICHMFLHAPQQTRYLFFHEMVVGYLVDQCLQSGEDVPEGTSAYWGLSTQFIERVAEISGRSPAETAALHFTDNASVSRALSPSLLDVCTVCTHLYWYLELFFVHQRHAPTDWALMAVLSHFALPSLDSLARTPLLELVPDAGRRIDEAFLRDVFGFEGQETAPSPSEAGVALMLDHFARDLWRLPR